MAVKTLASGKLFIPQLISAPRGLLSGGTTQFINTPNMLQYIPTIVFTEDMDKVQLKIRQETRPKRYSKKFLNLFGMRDLICNNKPDVGAVLICNYIDELGHEAKQEKSLTLLMCASMYSRVWEGRI